jgi:hypothetical protein
MKVAEAQDAGATKRGRGGRRGNTFSGWHDSCKTEKIILKNKNNPKEI